MASTEGGVEIEKVAEETPELIHKMTIDPLAGPQPYQGRELAFKLGLTGKQVSQFAKIFMGPPRCSERDPAMVEINPLVITKQGDLVSTANWAPTATPCSASRNCVKCVTLPRRRARIPCGSVGAELRCPRRQHRLHG